MLLMPSLARFASNIDEDSRLGMFAQLKSVARIGLGPSAAVYRLLTGGRLNYTEFASQTVQEDDLSLVQTLLKEAEGWADEGPIRQFEESFARWNGSLGACSFMSGRAALSAAISALQLRPGDEVVVPGYTCVVVANAFSFARIALRFCDIELDTYGPDFNSLTKAITPNTRAILLQHLYGLVARDTEKILDFARSKNIFVIEDCAHATGASLHDRKVGNFGDVAFFSMEQSKVLSTFNGGAALTNSADIFDRLVERQNRAPYPSNARIERLLFNFALSHRLHNDSLRWLTSDYLRYRHRRDFLQSTTPDEIRGLRSAHDGQKMPSPLARLAANQLKKIDSFNRRRRDGAAYWTKLCEEKNYRTPLVISDSVPIYLRYPVMVPANRKFDYRWCMREFGTRPGVWFVGELHPLAKPMAQCPNSRLAVEQCINLPTLGFSP